jgi:hypothetical protein
MAWAWIRIGSTRSTYSPIRAECRSAVDPAYDDIVRVVVVLGGLVACYAPHVPSGVACDPAAPVCPDGQICRREDGAFTCGGALAIDAALPVVDSPENDPDGPVTSPDGPPRVTYGASIAECIDPGDPDPARCRAVNGAQQLVVDIRDSTTTRPWRGFVRFDTDDQLVGRVVTAVTLRVTATSDAKAPGPSSGEIFRSSPFDLSTLATTTPTRVGSPIAPSQGAVLRLEPVEWPLPVGIVAASSPVFLEINPLDDDGVNYWNSDGANPPELIIDLQ